MIALLLSLAACVPWVTVAAQEYEKLAPWPAMRWREDIPEVQVEGRWYELVQLEKTKSADIVAFCKRTWPDRWQKRFEEDLVEVMARMERPLGAAVTAEVLDLEKKGKKTRLAGLAMTAENRKTLRDARAAAGAGTALLARADAQADLDDLARLLGDEYAYHARVGKAFEDELAATKEGLPESLERPDFARRVQALLCALGDGHTRLADLESQLPPGFLPFLVGDSEGKVVAFAADRSGLVDPEHPFLVALDGVPIERWLDAAARLVPRGSAGFVRWHALRQLRFAAWLRQELELPAGGELAVQLADERGRKATKKLPLAARKPVFGDWPRGTSRMLEDDVGYLRIAAMDDEPASLAALHDALAMLEGARALVIDVRGNGGGSRLPLRELFPYFTRPDDPPRIANVAAYRLHAGESAERPEGYLADRWLFPLSSSEWDASERTVLETFAQSFKAEWVLPARSFSAWHYFALRPVLPAGRTRCAGPVVVLQDGGCFSATDIFLGALKGWRDVTLVGTPSGGGSGRAAPHRLPRSGLELQASTMASFRADGTLYDGRGIEPDVVVWPQPTDFIGRGDAQLDAALARLAREKR